jgi:hypothetical protein
MGDARSLAVTMRRACTEKGLWQRLHNALPQAPTRAEMADGYLRLYRTVPDRSDNTAIVQRAGRGTARRTA